MAKYRRSKQTPRDRWPKTENTGQRPLRVGELVRHALSDIFLRETLRDPLLQDLHITISEVQMSPDLRHARVYVAPVAGADNDAVEKALQRVSPWLQHQVAQRVRLKYAMRLDFKIDRAFENAKRIDALLDIVRMDTHRGDGDLEEEIQSEDKDNGPQTAG